MIILLNYTIETRFAHSIKTQTNTQPNLRLIEDHYARLGAKNVYHHMIKHVVDNPGLYGSDVSLMVKEGQFNEAIDLALNNDCVMINLGYMFDDVYQKAFSDITSASKMVITLPHITTKPTNVDFLIGWAVAERDFEVDHMEEHEGISAKQGHHVCCNHNQWMRENKHIYDMFFDGSSEEEVTDYIRRL